MHRIDKFYPGKHDVQDKIGTEGFLAYKLDNRNYGNCTVRGIGRFLMARILDPGMPFGYVLLSWVISIGLLGCYLYTHLVSIYTLNLLL